MKTVHVNVVKFIMFFGYAMRWLRVMQRMEEKWYMVRVGAVESRCASVWMENREKKIGNSKFML